MNWTYYKRSPILKNTFSLSQRWPLNTGLTVNVWRFQGRTQGGGRTRHAPPKIGKKYDFFGVKSWFFTRNTPQIFAPPSARRNFLKYAPLTWNPGSAPVVR
jgi:hypothetical protein